MACKNLGIDSEKVKEAIIKDVTRLPDDLMGEFEEIIEFSDKVRILAFLKTLRKKWG